MKVESDELDESEKHWRLRYDSLLEEQNLLKNRSWLIATNLALYMNYLLLFHQINEVVSLCLQVHGERGTK